MYLVMKLLTKVHHAPNVVGGPDPEPTVLQGCDGFMVCYYKREDAEAQADNGRYDILEVETKE